MKRRIERELLRPGEDFNVKLGPGGIRDVEFVVQALQLLHGGRILQVRERSTQRALTSLAECGVLEREQAEGLLASYRFLRRVENRLQMREERQTHRIPSQPEPRERLARSLGFRGSEALAAFDRELESRRQRVRESFDVLLPGEGGDRVLQLFSRGAARLLAISSTRKMIDNLAQRFARELDTSARRRARPPSSDAAPRERGVREDWSSGSLDGASPESADARCKLRSRLGSITALSPSSQTWRWRCAA